MSEKPIAYNYAAAERKIARLTIELNNCRNELCLRCGQYKQRYLGACDGCRWNYVGREERDENDSE